MRRIVYAGLEVFEVLESLESSPANPTVDEEVRKALKSLKPELRSIICSYYFDGNSIEEIAAKNKLSEKQVSIFLRLAKKLLRNLLNNFVKSRWRIKVKGKCRVCSHRKRKTIDRMLIAKANDETWGAFGKRLAKVTGYNFQPPQILIAHLKHIATTKESGI